MGLSLEASGTEEQTKAGPGAGWTGHACQPVVTRTPGPFPVILQAQPGQGCVFWAGRWVRKCCEAFSQHQEEPGPMCAVKVRFLLLGRGGPLVSLLLLYFRYLRIYWAALGLRVSLAGFPQVVASGSYSGCGLWASPCSGFPLLSTGSRAHEPQ